MFQQLLNDRSELESLFEELAVELTNLGTTADVVMVGGSWMPEVIFVMKLYRADPQDREDLIALWPLCSFPDANEAADAFRSAYPHAPEDQYLAGFIAGVADDSRSA